RHQLARGLQHLLVEGEGLVQILGAVGKGKAVLGEVDDLLPAQPVSKLELEVGVVSKEVRHAILLTRCSIAPDPTESDNASRGTGAPIPQPRKRQAPRTDGPGHRLRIVRCGSQPRDAAKS